MQKIIEKHALIFFFALTYISSWLLWIASGVLKYSGQLPPLDNGWLIAQIGVFCPSLWALVFTAVLHEGLRRQCLMLLMGVFLPATLLGVYIAGRGVENPNDLPGPLRILIPAFAVFVLAVILFSRRILLVSRVKLWMSSLRWGLAAALHLPFMFLLAWLIINGPGGDFGSGLLEGGLVAALPVVVVLFSFDMVFGGALGEEIGWRGFALPRLLARWSPLKASLILGALWSLWHLPIDLTAGFGQAGIGGVLFRLLFTCSLSVIVVWYFIHSGHGMLTSLLIHTTLNWLPVMEFTHYETTMAFLFVLMFIFGLLILFGDSRFKRRP